VLLKVLTARSAKVNQRPIACVVIARAARRPASLLIPIILAAAACTGPTEPQKVAPSLEVVLGESATDTIGARLAVPLTILVRDSTGKPAHNSPVSFTVLPVPGSAAAAALVSPTTYVYPPGPQTAMKEWTDSSGQTAVTVQLGTMAGHVRIAIDGNVLPVHDTVTYTVLAGRAVRITTMPADSALYVNASYRLVARVLDRAGNVRADSMFFTVDSSAPVASVQANGTITGAAIGRARLQLSLADSTVTARARVSVVPRGTLGVVMSGYALIQGVARVNLDGSGYRMLTSNAVGDYSFPSWSPDGSNIIYNTADVYNGRLMRVDTMGSASPIQHAGTLPSETWPRYSYDGRYIYYTAGYYPDSLDTYRINADGSGTPVLVTPPRTGSMRYWKASPSPNSALLAYSEAGFAIATASLNDGSYRELSTPTWAEAPRFSPDGTWIAFGEEQDYQLHVISPDGTGYRTLTPPGLRVDYWGHDWSPDGAWIVVRTGAAGDQLSIVRVSDGLVIPLPYAGDMYEPTWRPIP
jgi:Tol biopolymer transport system component